MNICIKQLLKKVYLVNYSKYAGYIIECQKLVEVVLLWNISLNHFELFLLCSS